MSVLTISNAVPELQSTQALPSGASYTRNISQTTQPAAANTHRHSRTVSSTTLPTNPFASPVNNRPYIPSVSSTSTPSQQSRMERQSTTSSNPHVPRRSTSGRSVVTNSPTSYVTLMRKQKATVWCDRSQSIDARVAAEQKRAKQRAVYEVAGNNSQRTSTLSSGGVVGKIRHGGVPKAQQYTSPNLSGVNVPTRLLAYDMQGEDEVEGRILGDNSMVHARTGSGKSSINSGNYRSGYPRAHTSPPDSGSPAHEGIPEGGETPVPSNRNQYFDKKPSSDSEESFGELKDMTGPNSKQHALDLKAKEEDLRRRGSVDERTTTMTTKQRLFVANPDIEH